jgi:hypothetical protein
MENGELRIFGQKREAVAGGWREKCAMRSFKFVLFTKYQ